MDWGWTFGFLAGGLVVLMVLGVPVAVAFFTVNIVGAYVFLGGEAGLAQLVRNTVPALAKFTLAPIPLFILMGELLFHTGLAGRAVDAVDRLIARVPGRLSIVTVLGGTVFASLSGSSIANTAMLGGTLFPEMLRKGYHPSIGMGPIMAVGGIAMLIPPSALAVVLGSLAGVSVSKLLLAGVIPGIIMSVLFLGYIVLRCWGNEKLAPAYVIQQMPLWGRVRPFLFDVVPLLGIFVIVVGSIIAGYATPTESAALGVVASLVAAVCYRALTLNNLVKTLRETASITVMIMFIVAASTTFSQVLAISGAADGLVASVKNFDLPPIWLIVGMMAVLLVLGCLLDQVSMILLTVPVYFPLAMSMQVDTVWLAVMMLVAIEIGLLTPPFGLLLFVMKGVAPASIAMTDVYSAALPFLLLEVATLGLMLAAPDVVMWLPKLIE